MIFWTVTLHKICFSRIIVKPFLTISYAHHICDVIKSHTHHICVSHDNSMWGLNGFLSSKLSRLNNCMGIFDICEFVPWVLLGCSGILGFSISLSFWYNEWWDLTPSKNECLTFTQLLIPTNQQTEVRYSWFDSINSWNNLITSSSC